MSRRLPRDLSHSDRLISRVHHGPSSTYSLKGRPEEEAIFFLLHLVGIWRKPWERGGGGYMSEERGETDFVWLINWPTDCWCCDHLATRMTSSRLEFFHYFLQWNWENRQVVQSSWWKGNGSDQTADGFASRAVNRHEKWAANDFSRGRLIDAVSFTFLCSPSCRYIYFYWKTKRKKGRG